MEYNYLIEIEYDGTNFVGWQFQKNGTSVQDVIEKKLSKYFKTKIRLTGAGRTDKGVHALGQCANFKIKEKIMDKKKFLSSINFFLRPNLISILSIKKKELNFNSRYNAVERIYEYKIVNRDSDLIINKKRAWLIRKKINFEALKKGAKLLQGTHDFSTFRSSKCSSKSPIRLMKKIQLKKKGKEIFIFFYSKSFLQNQVRSMVGSLIYLALGIWDFKKFKTVFFSKNRKLCAPPAPACGLYLTKIIY
tara:strand:+ start:69 stop:812 length:744 start_codon:yes stop_codon:yes gene_type:complete